MIRWGDESARVGPWRTDGSVALLVPAPDGRAPTEEFARHCLHLVARQGYERVITGALSPRELPGFLAAGFHVHERLHLLLLDPDRELPAVPAGPRLRRVWGRRRRSDVLALDELAFDPFWRLDEAGLDEALRATPRRRFRVVVGDGRSAVGYAICGASDRRGFVQRLAVAPTARRHGIGRRLLLDGLAWMRAQGVGQIAVNTQYGNEAALGLYRSVGFRDDPDGLVVLSAQLDAVDPSSLSSDSGPGSGRASHPAAGSTGP